LPAKRGRPGTTDKILELINEERALASRQRVLDFDSIEESSLAVRAAMGAIEALGDANFSPTRIEAAKRKMDLLVAKWMSELDKVSAIDRSSSRDEDSDGRYYYILG
jgi:hypothetical protein